MATRKTPQKPVPVDTTDVVETLEREINRLTTRLEISARQTELAEAAAKDARSKHAVTVYQVDLLQTENRLLREQVQAETVANEKD